MKSSIKFLLGVVATVSAVGCAKNTDQAPVPAADVLAKAKTEAASLVGKEVVLSCAGRELEGSNEFVTVSIQSDEKDTNLVLGINRILISPDAKSVSRKGILIASVVKDESSTDSEQVYTAAMKDGSKGPQELKYDSVNQVLEVTNSNTGMAPFSMDCKSGMIR